MYKLLFSIITLFFTSIAFAQTPDKMSYQAVVRNAANEVVANQKIGMRISILQGAFDGPSVYSETQTPLTNASGLISIKIGEGESSNNFSSINWSSATHFIKTEIDPTGGTNYTITGVSQLLSVPYSFHSNTAERVTVPINYKQIADVPNIPEFIEKNAVTLGTSQEITGPKVFKGKVIINAPVEASEPTTKDYVDIRNAELLKKMEHIFERYAGFLPIFDKEGNAYKTVKIGSQIWFAENLKTTYLNDGTSIANPTDDKEWESMRKDRTPAYCWYENDKTQYEQFGALYNWYAVESNKLCPAGWKVASAADYQKLMDFLSSNGYTFDGNTKYPALAKALAAVTSWDISDKEGAPGNSDFPLKANASGFSALAGGDRHYYNSFDLIGKTATWWTTSEYEGKISSYVYQVIYNSEFHNYYPAVQYEGHSVRCIKN